MLHAGFLSARPAAAAFERSIGMGVEANART